MTNVYLVSFTLKKNGQQTDNFLHVAAETLMEAHTIAYSWRNDLRYGMSEKELDVRDIKLIIDNVITTAHTP